MTPGDFPPSDARAVQLAEQARAITGTLDAQQWALAALSLAARTDGIAAWAETIARVAGRSPRRVREWAAIYEYSTGLEYPTGTKWGFIAAAYKFREKLGHDEIVGLLETALAEDVSADGYEAELRDMCPDAEPDYPKQWRALSVKYLSLVDHFEPPVGKLLREIALAFSEAATAAGKAKA